MWMSSCFRCLVLMFQVVNSATTQRFHSWRKYEVFLKDDATLPRGKLIRDRTASTLSDVADLAVC